MGANVRLGAVAEEKVMMRAYVIRQILMLAIALGVSAGPALAQNVVRGTVLDAQGKPIPNATVLMEMQGGSAKFEVKTDAKGEFMQVGLASGQWNLTATSGQFKQILPVRVRAGQNPPLTFQLTPTSGLSEQERAAQGQMATVAKEAIAAMQAGDNDLAVTKFEELTVKLPNCSDCFYNLGVLYTRKKDLTKAEENLKKAVTVNPEYAEAYSALANVYNAQRKFDQAVEMSAKAASLAGTGAATAANAEAIYNQGVTLWNAQKYAEAKVQFEAATKADPKMGLAWYQLAMANLNLGQLPAAKEAFAEYLKVDPSGPKAAEVQALIKQLP